MHRFPENTSTTADVAIAALAEHGQVTNHSAELHQLWQSLSSEAAKAAEAPEPDWPKVKALWLIADACSMRLQGDSASSPYAPMVVMDSRRSVVPEDFAIDDLSVLSEVAAQVSNPMLRARLADLAWVAARPKKIADAHRAIDAYLELQPKEEIRDSSLKAWRRAIMLCLQLGRGARDRLEKIEADLLSLAVTAIPLDGMLGLAVARALFEHQLGNDQGERLSDLLAIRGEKFVEAVDCLRGRSYLGLACNWYTKLGNAERSADMTLAMALSWETEADQRIRVDSGSGHLVAGSFLESAIQTLRKIPKNQRASRFVEGHLERLQRRLSESGEQAVSAMHTMSTGPVDITELVQLAEKAVSGKSPVHALLQLVHLHPGVNVQRLTENAKQALRDFPLSALFASSHYGPDGRVIAKTPSGNPNESTEAEAKVFGTMMRHYLIDVELICRGQIIPAALVILREHTVTKADLAHLLSQSPIVPPGRVEQFTKALWEGLEQDFATAIHLLAPQVEHLVRWQLKQVGVQTTRVDLGGIENEIGLSSLIDSPEIKDVLGEGDAFELRALFCTAHGPNLRNNVAHGLLNDDDCNTTAAAYAWWWTLRLTLRSFLYALREASGQNKANDVQAIGQEPGTDDAVKVPN